MILIRRRRDGVVSRRENKRALIGLRGRIVGERSMLYVPFATVQRVRLLVGMETMTKVTIRLHDERINYLQCYYRTTKLEEYIYQFRFRDKRKGYLPGTKPLRNV